MQNMIRCAPPSPGYKRARYSGSDSPVGVLRLCGLRGSVRTRQHFWIGAVLPIVHAQQHGVARRVLVEAGAQAAQDQLHCHTGCWSGLDSIRFVMMGTGSAGILSIINATRCELQAQDATDAQITNACPRTDFSSNGTLAYEKTPDHASTCSFAQHSASTGHARG